MAAAIRGEISVKGGSLTFEPEAEERVFSIAPSPLYVFKSIFDIRNQIRKLISYTRAGNPVPIISSILTLFDRPIHLAYSIGYIADLILKRLFIIVSWLEKTVPILGLVFTGIEVIKDIIDTRHIQQISKEISEQFSDLSNIDTLEALKAKISKNVHYQEFLGKKVSGILTEHINNSIINPDQKGEKIKEIQEILRIQIKKAKIIHAVSIAALLLSAASVIVSMVFAPATVVLAVSFTSSVVSYAKSSLISAYLYQPKHSFKPLDLIPDWCKKLPSSIVRSCFGIFSRSRSSLILSQAPLQPQNSIYYKGLSNS